MNILALETSAKAASCAILSDGSLVAEFFTNAGLTHSETIMPMVRSMLECAKKSLRDMDVFAIAAGPGSFTGLRIGISAVKGMTLPDDKPCCAVSTLEALAYNLTAFNGIAVPLMDAHRGQVYTALFKNQNGDVTRLTDDDATEINEVYEKLKSFTEPVMLVGDGAPLYYRDLSDKLPNVLLTPGPFLHQRAGSVAYAARQRLMNGGGTCAPDALAPFYLRLSQAERELLEKQSNNHKRLKMRRRDYG